MSSRAQLLHLMPEDVAPRPVTLVRANALKRSSVLKWWRRCYRPLRLKLMLSRDVNSRGAPGKVCQHYIFLGFQELPAHLQRSSLKFQHNPSPFGRRCGSGGSVSHTFDHGCRQWIGTIRSVARRCAFCNERLHKCGLLFRGTGSEKVGKLQYRAIASIEGNQMF